MRRILRLGLTPSLVALALAGCNDRVPTLSGDGPFPVGGPGTTIEVTLEPDQLVLGESVFVGPTGTEDASELLVARNFDGALNAHALATFRSFPDSVVVDGEVFRSDGFIYLESEVVSAIPDTLAASREELTFQLWTIAQPWDTAAVSWENAVDVPGAEVAWTTPGGTRGELVSTTTWERADTAAAADSLRWSIDADVVSRLAAEEIPGLLVTLLNEDSRVSVSPLALRAELQPSVSADTTVVVGVSAGSQTFVFSPELPTPDDVYRVGGIRSDRTLLRLAVPTSLPGCAPPQICAAVPSDEVSIDQVDLFLDPAPVGGGFRPLPRVQLVIRRVLELELGERATLGQAIVGDTLSASRFVAGTDDPIGFSLTTLYRNAIADGEDELGVALLVEPEASSFGFAWFERNPRLRLLYTLPETPQLP